MFIDYVKIKVKAGDGGGGAVSFHREKYVSAGGPDGGDGGKGGDVVFVVNPGASSLIDYRYKTKFEAENGQPGGNRKCTGRSGKDLVLRVPAGTVVRDVATGRVLADLSGDEPVVIIRGPGWLGQCPFATPPVRSPLPSPACRQT